MKIEEAKEQIIKILKEKTTVTAQDVSIASKNAIPVIQVYTIMSQFLKTGGLKLNEVDGKKSYTLVNESKLSAMIAGDAKEPKSETKVKEKDETEGRSTSVKFNKGGRDLTKYKFNGSEYNKGRLAHAIIAQAAKDKKLSLKAALELFPNEIVPPYGLIQPIAEAKKMSKERQRFFIKPEEEIKLKDSVIAVSNQFTTERILKVIAIAKKQFGYSIK